MKTVSAAMKAHLSGEVTTLAVIWRILRQDGTEFYFTDATEDLVYEGRRYKAATGFMRSAIANSSSGTGDDLEVSGVLDDEGILEVDLLAGKFDYAEVWVRAVNYEDLSMGHVALRYGRFGEVRTTATGKFVIELRGLVAHLANSIGDTYSPDCRVDLFSAKCGLQPTADRRVAGKRYEAGSRITVPSDIATDAYAVPVPNLSFQDQYYQGSTIWVTQGMIVRVPEGVSYRVLSPTEWATSAYQDISLTEASEMGTLPVPLRAAARVVNFTDGLQYRLTLVFTDALGAETGTLTTKYISPQTGDIQLQLEGLAPEGTTHARIMVDTRMLPGFLGNLTNAGMSRILEWQLVVVPTTVNLVEDPGFASYTLGNASLAGWINTGVAALTSRQGHARPNGEPFVAAVRPVRSTLVSATVSLTAGPISGTMIDSGVYVIDLSWMQANLDINGQADIQAVFFGTPMPHGQASPLMLVELPTVGAWTKRNKKIEVPAGARTMQLRITFEASRNNISGDIFAAVADLDLSLRLAHEAVQNFSTLGGVEYEAANSGNVSPGPASGWPRTPGSTVVDGGVTWTAVAPMWSNLSTISTVLSRGIFTLAPGVIREDNFFRWGIILFLTGPNAGFSSDILSWDATTRRIDLVLPMPFVPGPGDQVWVQSGCDKIIETCHAKFDNVLNFRGEPWLPGTDQYFRIGSPV